MTFES